MNETRVDRWIADLLDDPLVSLMIKADKVDRAALAADLRKFRPSDEGRAVGGRPRAYVAVSQPPRASLAVACRLRRARACRRLLELREMISFFTLRPVFASALAVIMVMAGAICYFLLPVSQFPDITPPQVVVSAMYPGASAQVVADTVTTPLEQQINGVAGMTYMASSSSNDGSSTITITFDVGYPLAIAAVDVQNRVAQASASLPPIVNQGGVTIKKQNPNFVLIVNLTSPDHSVDPVALSNYASSADRRSLEAPAGRRRRADFRRASLFDARLARSRQTGQSRRHRRRRAKRRRRTEYPGRRRQDRPVAGAGGHAVRNAGQRRRPA